MHKDIISQMAQSVMVLCTDTTEVERDTIRLIIEEEGYNPDGSYEQVAQIVEECSMVAKLDLLTLWEQIIFGWVVGLPLGYDDFALYSPHKGLYALSPIFTCHIDIEASEMPLTLNGKNRGFTRSDFEAAMKRSGIRTKIMNGVFTRLCEALPRWREIVEASPLSEEFKVEYNNYLSEQIKILFFV